jgi:hypothetical protein
MNTVMLIPAETNTQAAMLGLVFGVVLSLGLYVWMALALAAVFRRRGYRS